MVASTSVPLTKKSQEIFISYYLSLQNFQNITRHDMRSRFEYIDRTYQREVLRTQDNERAKAANRAGMPEPFQDMTVPVVMPQVEAAVTHQTSVFLTGDPLFPVAAAPAFIDEALQLETVIESDSIRGGWTRELMMFFRDGFKYNFGPLEVAWAQEVTYSIETNLDKNLKEGTPKEVIWSGNKIRRLDPYNTFIDTRVSPSELHKKGEFAGFTEIMTRIELKSFIAALPDKIIANIIPAFESGRGTVPQGTDSGAQSFFIPQVNPDINEVNYKGGGTNWLQWAGLVDIQDRKIDYKDSYEVTTLYAKVLPSEFKLSVPNKNTPQIYKLIIVNHGHIIYAELQTNAHGFIPIFIAQPLEDGLDYQTKSLASNGTPFQELATAHMASITASRRRAISDRVLYDPSRITRANINSPNPSAKIPVRPSAYGEVISNAVFAFPYREDQAANSMQQIQTVVGLANQLTGQNPVSQGQFIKGNKTNDQFDQVMFNATGRDQMVSILLESQVFVPLKEILKINILQFQGGTTLFNRDKQVAVEIDPIALRKAVLEFRIADGLIPTNEILSSEAFGFALQTLQANAQLGAGFNLSPFFSYLMKTQGADVTPFEKSAEQIAFEQALQTWQAMAQLAIEKGLNVQTTLPPQPVPEQFGYVPAGSKPAPEEAERAAQAQNSNLTGGANLASVEIQ